MSGRGMLGKCRNGEPTHLTCVHLGGIEGRLESNWHNALERLKLERKIHCILEIAMTHNLNFVGHRVSPNDILVWRGNF